MPRESRPSQARLESVMFFPHETDLLQASFDDTRARDQTRHRYTAALEKLIYLLNGDLARSASSRPEYASSISEVFGGVREKAARECLSDPDLEMSDADRLWSDGGTVFHERTWADIDLGHLADDENVKAFLAELPSLLVKGHRSEFAAFARGKLVGIDADFETLCDKVERSHPEDSILIQQIDTCAPQVQLPSPRLL